jgi:hypothetical protein
MTQQTSSSLLLLSTADSTLAVLPLLAPLVLLLRIFWSDADNPVTTTVQRWTSTTTTATTATEAAAPSIGSQLIAYMGMAILGYFATAQMVPVIKQYTLRKGLSGKDMGKRGTSIADKEMYV